jgi:hypothetical protein
MKVFPDIKRRTHLAVDRTALKEKLDWEVQKLTHAERQFVKAIVSAQPDCPTWLREQILLSLGGRVNLEPTSPVAQAVAELSLSCGDLANTKTCEVVAHRELLKALDSTDKVVIAAEFLQHLVSDLVHEISSDSGRSGNSFVR